MKKLINALMYIVLISLSIVTLFTRMPYKYDIPFGVMWMYSIAMLYFHGYIIYYSSKGLYKMFFKKESK